MSPVERFRAVPRPRPVMSRQRLEELTLRQREILDRLDRLLDAGFADLNMAALANRLNCSLRTLYAIAPSRDELILALIDRHMRNLGRAARDTITDDMAALDAVRSYLHGVTRVLGSTSEAFAFDIESVPSINTLIHEHNDYRIAVTRALLDLAVEQGEMPPLDTAALARVMAGLSYDLTRPQMKPLLQTSAKEAADAVVDVVIRGLRAAVTSASDLGPPSGTAVAVTV